MSKVVSSLMMTQLMYSLLKHLIQLLSTENFIKEYSTVKELRIRSKTQIMTESKFENFDIHFSSIPLVKLHDCQQTHNIQTYIVILKMSKIFW